MDKNDFIKNNSVEFIYSLDLSTGEAFKQYVRLVIPRGQKVLSVHKYTFNKRKNFKIIALEGNLQPTHIKNIYDNDLNREIHSASGSWFFTFNEDLFKKILVDGGIKKLPKEYQVYEYDKEDINKKIKETYKMFYKN